MRNLRYLFYELQYCKYVRCLPFFVVRHNGPREFYSPFNVDQAIRMYAFNRRFSPIGYALLCNSQEFKDASEAYQPSPTREYIRQRIAKMYFGADTGFSIYDLMKMSLYKSDWSGLEETGFSVNEEYWGYIGEFELLDEKRSSPPGSPQVQRDMHFFDWR